MPRRDHDRRRYSDRERVLASFPLPTGYDLVMIRNEAAYRRQTEQGAQADLRSMTAEESIAIGEALLTSDLMRVAVFPDDDRPRSLAIALGIDPQRARGRCSDGTE